MNTITKPYSPYQALFNLALPMAGTQLITIASGFLCMTMLAKLGADVLAASALIFSLQLSVLVVGMSSLFALCIVVGHAYGNKDYDKIGVLVQQGWVFALFISLPLMFLFWHIKSILIYFGQEEHLSEIVQQFYYAHMWRVAPVLLSVCNQQLCYGIQRQRIDLIANVIGVGVLLLVADTLIFGHFGFPAFGVKGFGYALSAQSIFYLIFTTLCFIKIPDFKKFRLFHFRLHQQWQTIKEVFKISWPISLQISGELFSLFIIATMMGWLGVKVLSAYQIINQYVFLILIPIFALSQATGVLISQACGEKQFSRIVSIARVSVQSCMLIGFIIAVIFMGFPKLLASAFIDVNLPENAAIIQLTRMMFIAMSFSIFFDAIRNVLTGALRGILDTRFPMTVGLVVIWLVGVPLSYLLGFAFKFGAIGIVMGTVIAMLVGSVVLYKRWNEKVAVFPADGSPLPQAGEGSAN